MKKKTKENRKLFLKIFQRVMHEVSFPRSFSGIPVHVEKKIGLPTPTLLHFGISSQLSRIFPFAPFFLSLSLKTHLIEFSHLRIFRNRLNLLVQYTVLYESMSDCLRLWIVDKRESIDKPIYSNEHSAFGLQCKYILWFFFLSVRSYFCSVYSFNFLMRLCIVWQDKLEEKKNGKWSGIINWQHEHE